MGNRAIITDSSKKIGVYLHWNGGYDSVSAFLRYCKLQGQRSPEIDGYGYARLAQVIGNFFGGSTSVGICCPEEYDIGWLDNGVYIVENWEIVGREGYEGEEQNEYSMEEMLESIDKAQPEALKLHDIIHAKDYETKDLKIGDVVVSYNSEENAVAYEVAGFGKDEFLCGTNVNGMPYIDMYSMKGDPENNINNYITEDKCLLIKKA